MATMSATLSGPVGNRQALVRGVSSILLGVPTQDNQAPPQSANAPPGSEPLRRQGSSQMNRTRVEENRRIVARDLLQEMLPLFGCTAVLIPSLGFFAIFVLSVAMYALGWVVLFNFYSADCDQPLSIWLMASLLLPVAQGHLCATQDSHPVLKKLQAISTPLATLPGIFMVWKSETCHETNAELYEFCKLYVTYQIFILTVMVFLHYCLHWGFVALVLWLHGLGIGDVGPGPHSAARPGLIDELETIQLSDLAVDGEQSDDEALECPICQETYDDSHTIKRTPCGHAFHESCLGSWLEKYGKTCPLCRNNLDQALHPEGEGSDSSHDGGHGVPENV
mmetsp:Transcript_47648/g.102020  ORF Transcript_47648/g.102020 Transcript_47648/m.102020 type:complete len:336 (-) Transcript_47648:9-1016(-)